MEKYLEFFLILNLRWNLDCYLEFFEGCIKGLSFDKVFRVSSSFE